MLKQQAKLFSNIAICADLTAIVVAFFCAYFFRSRLDALEEITNYLWALLIILPVWYFFFMKFGLYSSLRAYTLPKILASVVKVHAAGALVTASIFFLLHSHDFSRLLFGYLVVFALVLTSAEKTLFRLALGYIRKKGYNYRNILIAGTDSNAVELAKLMDTHEYWGMHIVGFLQVEGSSDTKNIGKYAVLGPLDNIVQICKCIAVDEVVFCLHKRDMFNIDEHLLELEDMGITVRMVLDFYASRSHRKELSYFQDTIPMITFYSKPFDAGQLVLKRCLDITGALVGLAITAALFPFIATAIKLNSPGPLFFGQTRVRENGRLFTCWKFRTMYMDADERKKELMHLNEMKGAIFKIANDPRITSVGVFLRKTSIDELLQFWNVLRGEMSLVGTRPPTPDEVAHYDNWHRKRICIKPGITGLWQVSGRNQIRDFDEVVRLDLEYIEQWSFWLDIKILLKTCWIVFNREGSC